MQSLQRRKERERKVRWCSAWRRSRGRTRIGNKLHNSNLEGEVKGKAELTSVQATPLLHLLPGFASHWGQHYSYSLSAGGKD